MNRLLSIALLLLLSSVACVFAKGEAKEAKAPPHGGQIVSVTSENFDSIVGATEDETVWLLKFYIPKCPHCEKMDTWMKSTMKRTENNFLAVADINGYEEKKLVKEYNVTGYPTLFFRFKGELYTYEGKNTAQDVISYAEGGESARRLRP